MDDVYSLFENLIMSLSLKLKQDNKILILPLFPYSENSLNYVSRKRFEKLSNFVDYFNIMTYDYISHIDKK